MQEPIVDLSKYENHLGRKHQVIRLIWNIVWPLTTWFLPRSIGSGWKRFLLKLFGAKIHSTAVVYSSVKIYMPCNLVMDEYACLASNVDCYNVNLVKIGKNSTISQKSYLCTASHDITNPLFPLKTAPIIIEDQAWIAADTFIGMGVNIGQGAIVGARSAVFKDVDPWTIVGGNPAKYIKNRSINKIKV